MFGHAEGETVASKIMAQLKADNMPIEKLCTLVRDGLTVDKTIFTDLQAKIKDEVPELPGFVDLGSCILHTAQCIWQSFEEDVARHRTVLHGCTCTI